MSLLDYLRSDTEISKIDIKVKIAFSILAIYWIYNFFSFDNTNLKYIHMEPFSEPIQIEIKDGKPFSKVTKEGVVEITPLAEYRIHGRIYAIHHRPTKMYYAAVHPYDISIGFGDYQYKEVYKAVRVMMSETISYLSWRGGHNYRKITNKYFKDKNFVYCFTNNHICPANKNVEKGIRKLKKKDIVYLEGYLMKWKHYKKDGTTEESTSSTSRNDGGDQSMRGNNGSGSCEQIYVTKVISRHGFYK